ncbi:MAG: DUF1194 domain-containing protein [Rhodospirillales bacterium]|nr:DUF1194 domain-containing protein [Rhodospirillales bacterium]
MRVIALALFAALAVAPARAAEPAEAGPVDVALVLVSDVSRSIDDAEFRLQKQGYQAAFTSPDVIAAIGGGPARAIAVAYIEFASPGDVRTVLDWTVIRDAATASGFAARLAAAPRSFWGRTAIGAGIAEAMADLAASGYQATRQVIDVCGDGTSNAGPSVEEMRDRAVADGITINGLTIINDHPVSWAYAHVQPPGGLTAWYRAHVVGGPGSFVLEIHDFASFGQAMTRKLVDEIARR